MTFTLLYARAELRRRWARALFTALGLAAGVSLVVGIIGVSQGLDAAQTRVLSPLTSVGTDVLITRVVGASPSSPSSSSSQGASQGTGGFIAGAGSLNQQDLLTITNENQNVVTDLSTLGPPGSVFTHDFFLPGTLVSFPDAAVAQVTSLPGVASVTSGLSLLASHQTGTVPKIVASVTTGGDTYTATSAPAPLTGAEQLAIFGCISSKGGIPTGPPTAGGYKDVFDKLLSSGILVACLPDRYKSFAATIITRVQTVQQVVNPPKTDITSSSYTAAGIDTAHPDAGLITRAQLTDGQYPASGAADHILLNVAYAGKHNLHTGSTVPINGVTYVVSGLVSPTLTGNVADIYFPLPTLQQLSGKAGRINVIMVKAKDSSSVDQLAADISKVLPGAQVITTKTLASQVTGSLNDAKALSDRLGTALAAVVLAAAFLIAILLTLSTVAKRVREIGTLRAIGWTRSRVVRQLLLETTLIAIAGGLIGVALGIGVDAAVAHYSPQLTAGHIATIGQQSSSAASFFGQKQSVATSQVTIDPPLSAGVLVAGVIISLIGGLLAGGIGGLRAARLQPAVALRDVG